MQRRKLIQYAGKYGDETYSQNVYDFLDAFNNLTDEQRQILLTKYKIQIDIKELIELYNEMYANTNQIVTKNRNGEEIRQNQPFVNQKKYSKILEDKKDSIKNKTQDEKTKFYDNFNKITELSYQTVNDNQTNKKVFNDKIIKTINSELQQTQQNMMSVEQQQNMMSIDQQPNMMSVEQQQQNMMPIDQQQSNMMMYMPSTPMNETGLNKVAILNTARQIEDSIKQAQGLVNELKTNLGVTDEMMGGRKRRSKKDNRVVRRSSKKQSPKKQQRGGKQKSPKK